jgi:hypothetical protein
MLLNEKSNIFGNFLRPWYTFAKLFCEILLNFAKLNKALLYLPYFTEIGGVFCEVAKMVIMINAFQKNK